MKSWCIGKDSDAGRDWGQEEKGTTEDEMAGWHHQVDGRESEWTPGDGDGQGGLACCNSWGRKESDTTERLNWTELIYMEGGLNTFALNHDFHVKRHWLMPSCGMRFKGVGKWDSRDYLWMFRKERDRNPIRYCWAEQTVIFFQQRWVYLQSAEYCVLGPAAKSG